MTVPSLLEDLAFAGLGLVLGLGYFRALRANIRMYLEGGRPWQAAGVLALRLGGAAVAFWLASRWGAAAAIAMLGGFLVARFLSLREARQPC